MVTHHRRGQGDVAARGGPRGEVLQLEGSHLHREYFLLGHAVHLDLDLVRVGVGVEELKVKIWRLQLCYIAVWP